MKRYIVISEVESSQNEVMIKVEPLFCMEDRTEDMFPTYLDEYVPTKGDKLYFLPGVNVPRIKLKDLALQHGIRTVRNIDDATHIFAAKNTKDKITSGVWKYSMDLTNFIELMNDPNVYIDDRYRENIREALENYQEDRVLFDYSVYNDIRHADNDILKSYDEHVHSSKWYNSIDDDYSDLCHKIAGAIVYDEMAILKHINGDDATIIDEAMFEQISQMFQSNDNDNHILAMEIMANSNYIESLLFLEMLFKEHSYQISSCHTKNHVNFKSLIGFLKKNKNYLGTDIDDIIKSLIDKDVLTTDKLDVLMRRYSNEIGRNGDTNYFKVKTVTISEDLLKELNTNYIYQHVNDFIPEPSEDNSPGVARVATGVEGVESDIELPNEDIEEAFTRIERNELKSELIALEDGPVFTEAEDYALGEMISKLAEESESNNNQKEQDDTNFDWF
jgi:hypothetical protein